MTAVKIVITTATSTSKGTHLIACMRVAHCNNMTTNCKNIYLSFYSCQSNSSIYNCETS